jgi:pterin-4a-carbinolamine dehydratase
MKSQLAEAARRSLTQDVKRMTAEQRLAAFLAHCQLMAQLASAGGATQHRPERPVPRNAD